MYVCKIAVPKGSRTPVAGMKTRCPRPLDEGDRQAANSNCHGVTFQRSRVCFSINGLTTKAEMSNSSLK